MPAFWTSTTFSSILRQAVAVAKHVPRASSTGVVLTGRRARQALVQLAKETFPILTETSGHLVNGRPAAYALEPIRLGTRHHRPLSAHARLMASSRNIRTGSGARFRVGPGMAGNVGLGSARTFASGPSASAVHSNVPVVLRAFAALLSDEEVEKSLPRATRFKPYKPRRSSRQRTRRIRSIRGSSSCSVGTIDSHLSITDLTNYFPYVQPTISKPLPPTVDTLVTPGSTTILSLPLSPSLSALLSSTTDVPYAAAEVGVAVLSSLTLGVLSLQEAFSLHYWHKIGPLLARLDDLGFMNNETEAGRGVRHEMVLDGVGRPDILRLTFEGRSEADIMTLLGGWLVTEGGRVWWGLKEITEVSSGVMELSRHESREMMEVWDEPQQLPPSPNVDSTPQSPQVDLIFPALDASVSALSPAESAEDWASGQSTPTSLYSPISDLDLDSDYGSHSYISSPDLQSLTASLLSQLSSVSSVDSQRWSVQPSLEDSEVEAAEMYSGSGSEVWAYSSEGSESDEGEVESQIGNGGIGSWAGVGEGFGLAQPW